MTISTNRGPRPATAPAKATGQQVTTMADDNKSKTPPDFQVEFYRTLSVGDEKTFSNVDNGIELYQGKRDRKTRPTEASINFERSLGLFSTSYVRLVQELLRKHESKLSPAQKLLVDFGALDPRIMQNNEVVSTLCAETVASHDSGAYEIFYVSNWLEKVSRGRIKPTSEAAQSKKQSEDEEKEAFLKDKEKKLEEELGKFVKQENEGYRDLCGIFKCISPAGAQADKLKVLKALRTQTARLEAIIKEENARYDELDSIKLKLDGDKSAGGIAADRKNVRFSRMREEFDTLITVIRGCSVRGGLVKNTPALIDRWVPMDSRLVINTVENLAGSISKFEDIDCTIFTDKRGNRRPPLFLVVPGVGTGMAWGDRIAVSLFPPPTMQPDVSIVRTLGGYRWYNATKSFNWKHIPGELGSMYQLIYPDKTFNHLQKSFLDDYVNWITREALGYQTLKPDVRKLFWRKIPFSPDHRRDLSRRATVYGKLYAEDLAREK